MKPQISCGAWLERFTKVQAKVQAWGAAGVAILLAFGRRPGSNDPHAPSFDPL